MPAASVDVRGGRASEHGVERVETPKSVTATGRLDEAPTNAAFPGLYCASFLAVVVSAVAANFVGGGTNLLPSLGFPSDCDRAWKARRLEALVRSGLPPRAIILGSSRVTAIEPEYVERLTGLRCFNCGVSVGCPVDYLTQFRFLLSLGVKPEMMIVGVDELAFGDHRENDAYDLQLVTHAALFRQAPLADQVWIAWRSVKSITLKSTRISFTNLTHRTPIRRREDAEDPSADHNADGSSKHFLTGHDAPGSREALARGIDEKVKFWSALLDEPSKLERMRPQPRMIGYFRELMTLAREHHVEVYVALLPIHPEYECRVFTPRLSEIRRELSTLLRETCLEFGARYRDLSSLESFGGSPDDFTDGTHTTGRNSRRMLEALLVSEKPGA
jgi:lysophospholipase L1-like esterase